MSGKNGRSKKADGRRPTGDAKPAVEAQVVSFSTDFGDTQDPETVELETEQPMHKVVKESQLEKEKKMSGKPWVEPRMSFDKLLNFYDINVWHKRCVLTKAFVIAGLGWDLVTDEDDKEPDQDYRRIMQLLENPNGNPEESFSEICNRMLIDYGTVGNCFLETPRNLKGEITELFHARAATVRRDKGLKNGGYWQGVNLNRRRDHFANFGSDYRKPGENELLHYYMYDPKSDYYGIPDWYPSLADQLMDRSVTEYYINIFSNQLMAKFAIIVEGGKLSPKALKSVKNFIKNKHSGIENAGGTLYLNSEQQDVKIKIEKLNIDFGKDGDGKSNLRGQARDTVVASHGVPPRMVGIMQAGQLGGGGEVSGQLKTWKENDINPRQTNFEDFLNNTVIASFGDHKWKLKFREMDVTDMLTDAKFWEKALNPQNGWANRDEAREHFNMSQEEEEAQQQREIEKFMQDLPEIYNRTSTFRKLLETADRL